MSFRVRIFDSLSFEGISGFRLISFYIYLYSVFISIFREKQTFLFFIDCNQGTHGLGCKQTCGNCMNNESCFHINGSCLTGCDPGYEGEKCNTGMLIHFCPYDLVLKKNQCRIKGSLSNRYIDKPIYHSISSGNKTKRHENMNAPTVFRCKHPYLNKPFMTEHHETSFQLWQRKTKLFRIMN